MFESGTRRGEITDGEQEEQNSERGENNLQRTVQPQRADKHDGGEQSPHGEICGHRRVVGRGDPSQFREDDQCHERQPEEAIGNESGRGESVAFPPFHDAGDDLRGAAIANTHGQNHAVKFVETGIVQVQQHGGHAKAEQPERSGIAGGVLELSDGFVHMQSAEGLEVSGRGQYATVETRCQH